MQQLEFDFVKEFYGEGEPMEMPVKEARMFIVKSTDYNVYGYDPDINMYMRLYLMDEQSFMSILAAKRDIYLAKGKDCVVRRDVMEHDATAYKIVF